MQASASRRCTRRCRGSCFWPPPPAQSRDQQEGRISSTMPPSGGITDVPGIKVGQVTRTERLTGCTVILAEAGAVAGVDVRGSAPGTIETDLLNPVNLVQQVHAVFLSGGSAFGLDVATGVRKYLYERKIGFETRVGAGADRPWRDSVRSRRGQSARHLADGRLRLSRGGRRDQRAGRRRATSVRVRVRRLAKRAAAGR